MKGYFNFKIKCNPEQSEMFLALLGELPFEMFEETTEGLEAYIQEELLTEAVELATVAYVRDIGVTYKRDYVPPQNWNKDWEANFQAVRVGNFCGIRADFHSPFEGVEHDIVINPKMAFGTGHHATTWAVINAMQMLDFTDKKVFDFGCGTGILAILAYKLGARNITAIDFDEAAVENALENYQVNDTPNISTKLGSIELVQGETFDIILANINRNVILDSLAEMYNCLSPKGHLLVSGIMQKDEMTMTSAFKAANLQILDTIKKDDWLCFHIKKINP